MMFQNNKSEIIESSDSYILYIFSLFKVVKIRFPEKHLLIQECVCEMIKVNLDIYFDNESFYHLTKLYFSL